MTISNAEKAAQKLTSQLFLPKYAAEKKAEQQLISYALASEQ